MLSKFGVELIDYGRSGSGMVLASGCGLGLALMDVVERCRWFVDVDRYRFAAVDWEAVGVHLSLNGVSEFILAGWFTIDVPRAFDAFERGIVRGKVSRYEGGKEVSLEEFLSSLEITSH